MHRRIVIVQCLVLQENKKKTRIEPVGKPDREVALFSWKEMSKMRWSQSDSHHVFSYVLYSKHQITKKLRLLRSVIYFLCCEIELFIHSCSIERKQTITDHCIKYCKALDITNNSQIWGTSILIKNGSKIRKKKIPFVSFWYWLNTLRYNTLWTWKINSIIWSFLHLFKPRANGMKVS